MARYKMLALDMDGTLLTEEKKITPRTVDAIHAAKAAGIKVIMATGRSIPHVLPYMAQLDLDTPIVAVNASEVWSSPGVLHRRTLLDLESVDRLLRLAIQYDTWYWAYAVGAIYNRRGWVNSLSGHEWLKFGFYDEDPIKLAEIRQTIASWNTLELSNSSPYNLELNPKGVHKSAGIREVCSMLAIEMHEVVAVGDSLNDVTMLRDVGLGVAMGNAQEEVKRIADTVTASNEEDGVAEVIVTHVLRGQGE